MANTDKLTDYALENTISDTNLLTFYQIQFGCFHIKNWLIVTTGYQNKTAHLPQETAGRDSIIQILQGLAKAIVKYQDPSSGTWYQVTDQGAREGNYLESSATALFIYTLAKAINKGYIGNEYIEPTQKAFDGMVKTFTRLEEDGSYTITNCCAVAGLGGDSKRYRDGSFEYYISEPIIENDPKSVGSFILAAIEYEKMTKK